MSAVPLYMCISGIAFVDSGFLRNDGRSARPIDFPASSAYPRLQQRPPTSGPFLFRRQGMSDEAHFSAQPACPQAPSRLPLALRDSGRAQGSRRAPRAGPQDAVGLTTLTRRADFLAANRGERFPMPGFVLLVRRRGDDSAAMRIGYTVTKKIGNAVVRNRIKRRFRALARALLPTEGVAGADHVLIGRTGADTRAFADLQHELGKALAKAKR
jgi:ribonuclease P protein component